MKTRMPKGWRLFGTNAQDALTPVERRNSDRKWLKTFQHLKKLSADEWMKQYCPSTYIDKKVKKDES